MTKAEAQYWVPKGDHGNRCGDCKYWDGKFACQYVEGEIAFWATCALVQPVSRKTRPMRMGKAG